MKKLIIYPLVAIGQVLSLPGWGVGWIAKKTGSKNLEWVSEIMLVPSMLIVVTIMAIDG